MLCVSSECLSKDKFLRTQMDYDQFIPISIVAELEDVKKITENLTSQSKMDAIIKTLQGEEQSVKKDERRISALNDTKHSL